MHTVAERAAGVEQAFPQRGQVVTHRERGTAYEVVRLVPTPRSHGVWLQRPRPHGCRRRRPAAFFVSSRHLRERYELAEAAS